MTRVLIADDQPLVRGGLVALFDAAPGFEVVGEAADGAEALLRCRELRPDLVLMDIRMPVRNGIAATRDIVALPDPPRVVVLTTFDLDDYVYAALSEGASGFLLKDTPPRRIISALEAVMAGEVLVSPVITRRLVERYGQVRSARPEGMDRLTPRESEVLGLVGRGLDNAEIAAGLVLSEETVKTHVKRVMSKLGLRSRAQAVVIAYESGLVRPGGGT